MSDPARRVRKFPLRLDEVAGSSATPQRKVLRPQAPVQHAKRDAALQQAPSGLGLDSADVRKRMAARLRDAGVRDERALPAMAQVPRPLLVDEALVKHANQDTSQPKGHGQTI